MESLIAYIRHSLGSQFAPEEVKSLSAIICTDLLGMSALDLFTCKDIDLSADKLHKLNDIIARLLRHEPIQYIRGYAEFCDLTFRVTSEVLIPRPETQELVQLIVEENKDHDGCRVLDIGTGSGCIAIALDRQLVRASVTGWDASEGALRIAQENNCRLHANVSFVVQDVFCPPARSDTYDIIVSNPPYVTESDKKEMQSEVLDYEPSLALFVPDTDPLRYYRRISELSKDLLCKGSRLYFEINSRFGADVASLLQIGGWNDVRILKDIYQNDRMVTARR
jgi:release factor glutamine methyltransferase